MTRELSYDDLRMIGARSLAPGERWCVFHPEGPIEETASIDFTVPVIIACQALNRDWGELTDQGWYLGILPPAAAAGE